VARATCLDNSPGVGAPRSPPSSRCSRSTKWRILNLQRLIQPPQEQRPTGPQRPWGAFWSSTISATTRNGPQLIGTDACVPFIGIALDKLAPSKYQKKAETNPICARYSHRLDGGVSMKKPRRGWPMAGLSKQQAAWQPALSDYRTRVGPHSRARREFSGQCLTPIGGGTIV
jgi:hypothetical protein